MLFLFWMFVDVAETVVALLLLCGVGIVQSLFSPLSFGNIIASFRNFKKLSSMNFDYFEMYPLVVRDGPLETLWGEGNFRAAGIFFRYQIPCMNFF